jgi:hypothetical protein
MTITRLYHTLPTLYVHSQILHAKPRPLKLLPVSLVFLVGFLLFSLGGCSAGASSTSVPTQTATPVVEHSSPTPTPLPAGTILYQANWSHGLAGWTQAQGWKVVQGQLESDSSNSAMFTIPYKPSRSDYAIEIRLEIVRLLSQTGASSFDIFAIKASGRAGYQAGVSNILGSAPHPMAAHPQAQIFLDPFDYSGLGNGLPNAFYPRSGWQTYRVEVRGNEAIFLVDGTQISSATSQQTSTLSNGPLGLSSQMIVLRVSSVRILAL